MSRTPLLEVADLSYSYGTRQALDRVGFSVEAGEMFGLLGPNGGGKTTLFRLLTTLLPLESGRISVCGFDLRRQPAEVRSLLGVTFQSPSLDGRLTVLENLRYQGLLHGLRGPRLQSRMQTVMGWLGLDERLHQRAETLSGGLKRRVEVAKSLLHRPRLLILDEPSTGLDPGARQELAVSLERIRRDEGVTVLITTHLMDEAERCDRLLLLDQGRVVATGSPLELRASLSGSTLRVASHSPGVLAEILWQKWSLKSQQVGQELRLDHDQPQAILAKIFEELPDVVESVTWSKPTLEDVFIQRTGRRFYDAAPP